jgi:hypothetical protein
VPPQLYVVDDHSPRRRRFATPRIGIGDQGEWTDRALRFCWDSPHLSRPLINKTKRGV